MQIFAKKKKQQRRASHIKGIARPADANGYDNANNYVIRTT